MGATKADWCVGVAQGRSSRRIWKRMTRVVRLGVASRAEFGVPDSARYSAFSLVIQLGPSMIPVGIRSIFRSTLRRGIAKALPERYTLAYEFFLDRRLNRMEEELRYIDRIVDRGELALDIGANRGLYSYALSKIFRSVVAFEPNPGMAAMLRRMRPGNVEVEEVGLSAAPGELEFFIPIVDGVEQSGWASFDRGNLAGAEDFQRFPVPVRTLDSFEFPEVSFIKIDVEGHETSVLQGAVDTIRRCHPVLLVEVRSSSEDEVFEYFEALGYTRFRMKSGALVRHLRDDREYSGENFVFRFGGTTESQRSADG